MKIHLDNALVPAVRGLARKSGLDADVVVGRLLAAHLGGKEGCERFLTAIEEKPAMDFLMPELAAPPEATIAEVWGCAMMAAHKTSRAAYGLLDEHEALRGMLSAGEEGYN